MAIGSTEAEREENDLRLLVIEDDPDLNRQLATALTDAGYVVDRAFDGEEGHYLGETEPYDAVILDIGLPKMDGISVIEAWRRAGRATPAPTTMSQSRSISRRCSRASARCCAARSAMPKASSPAAPCGSTRAPGACRSRAIPSSSPATNTGCCPI